jgi:para-aminobenzoate synthetase component 1
MSERIYRTFPVTDFHKLKEQMLNWCSRFNIFAFLDNREYAQQQHVYECIAGCGVHASVLALPGSALIQLQEFLNNQNDWIFGHLAYDLMEETEGVRSRHVYGQEIPALGFFVPEVFLQLSATELLIGSVGIDPEAVWTEISTINPPTSSHVSVSPVHIHQGISREQYLQTVDRLKAHIFRGDCYEINYCIPFYAKDVQLDPVDLYSRLGRYSPNPFSAFYRMNDQYLLCASPERFICKRGDRIFSQPMKGTIARNHTDPDRDIHQQYTLAFSKKDQSENVMVVDLVRNDLSRICKEGTVQVDELFGVYAFPQVYQMISTISGKLQENIQLSDILKAVFPMGSMTGAPKRRVLELIDQYEVTGRGLFSGSVGYISPSGDFDFNVVIRSLFYNASQSRLSFYAGSGITAQSDPDQEYQECLLKAAAIREVLLKSELAV